MSNISRISFLAETTGSPAYLTKGSKSSDSPTVEKPTPRAETTGSPAYSKLGVLSKTLNGYDSVSFRGETSGSPAYSKDCPEGNCPQETPKNKSVNFKGSYDSYRADKSTSPLTYATIAGGLAASAIAALGYAHKANTINKLSEGNLKKTLEPVAKKCYDWCHSLKTSAVDLKNKVF